MIRQMRNNFLKTVMGLFMLSFVFVACNDASDKKADAPAEDTTQTVTPEPTPAPAMDTTMKVDTADTRPVKPTE